MFGKKTTGYSKFTNQRVTPLVELAAPKVPLYLDAKTGEIKDKELVDHIKMDASRRNQPFVSGDDSRNGYFYQVHWGFRTDTDLDVFEHIIEEDWLEEALQAALLEKVTPLTVPLCQRVQDEKHSDRPQPRTYALRDDDLSRADFFECCYWICRCCCEPMYYRPYGYYGWGSYGYYEPPLGVHVVRGLAAASHHSSAAGSDGCCDGGGCGTCGSSNDECDPRILVCIVGTLVALSAFVVDALACYYGNEALERGRDRAVFRGAKRLLQVGSFMSMMALMYATGAITWMQESLADDFGTSDEFSRDDGLLCGAIIAWVAATMPSSIVSGGLSCLMGAVDTHTWCERKEKKIASDVEAAQFVNHVGRTRAVRLTTTEEKRAHYAKLKESGLLQYFEKAAEFDKNSGTTRYTDALMTALHATVESIALQKQVKSAGASLNYVGVAPSAPPPEVVYGDQPGSPEYNNVEISIVIHDPPRHQGMQ